eukprot:1160769-Pelagomonas_calceolata.AAC.10
MLSGMRSVIGLPSVSSAAIPSHSPPLPPSSFAFDPELALLGKLRLRTSTIPATSFAPPESSRLSPTPAEGDVGDPQRAAPRAGSRAGNPLRAWSAVACASVEAMLLQAVGAGRVSGGACEHACVCVFCSHARNVARGKWEGILEKTVAMIRQRQDPEAHSNQHLIFSSSAGIELACQCDRGIFALFCF